MDCISKIFTYFQNLYINQSINFYSILIVIYEIGYFPFPKNEEVFHLSDVKVNSIKVFYDMSCEKQNNIRNYF